MKRRSGKNSAVIILACFFQMANPGVSTSPVQSKRVSRILKKAQLGERPIRITEFEGSPGSPYSGTVDFDDPNEIRVSINRNLPFRTAENNLVHELFHIILFKQGFRYTAGSYKFNEPGDTGPLYTAAAKALTNCYVDPLIDRRMAKEGFEPYLVTQLTADGLASIQSSDVLKSSQLAHWADYAAMQLYCLSLRPGNFKIQEVERALSVNPLIIDKESRLRASVSACHTPDDCFARMKALRALTGFETDILLMNPRTAKYE